MIKFYGDYKCGCCGDNHEFADGTTAKEASVWFARNYCPECAKKPMFAEPKRFWDKFENYDLPELSGSEKQINWANRLRDDWMGNVMQPIYRDMTECYKQHDAGNIDDAKMSTLIENMAKYEKAMEQILDNETDSKYWIDMEMNNISAIKVVREAAKEITLDCREEEAKMYTLKELAPIIGVTPCTLSRYINTGKLAATKIAGKWMVSQQALVDAGLLAENAAITPEEPEDYCGVEVWTEERLEEMNEYEYRVFGSCVVRECTRIAMLLLKDGEHYDQDHPYIDTDTGKRYWADYGSGLAVHWKDKVQAEWRILCQDTDRSQPYVYDRLLGMDRYIPLPDDRAEERPEMVWFHETNPCGMVGIPENRLMDGDKMIIRPADPITTTGTSICITATEVIVTTSGKYDAVVEVLKGMRYKFDWSERIWVKKISAKTGNAIDRATETAIKLLANGMPVEMESGTLYNQILTGKYEPACTRWIEEDPETGKLLMSWPGRSDNLYSAAKHIDTAKWSSGRGMLVSPKAYNEIRDFANLYDFKITGEAEKMLCAAEKEFEAAMIMDVQLETPAKPADFEGGIDESLRDND